MVWISSNPEEKSFSNEFKGLETNLKEILFLIFYVFLFIFSSIFLNYIYGFIVFIIGFILLNIIFYKKYLFQILKNIY